MGLDRLFERATRRRGSSSGDAAAVGFVLWLGTITVTALLVGMICNYGRRTPD